MRHTDTLPVSFSFPMTNFSTYVMVTTCSWHWTAYCLLYVSNSHYVVLHHESSAATLTDCIESYWALGRSSWSSETSSMPCTIFNSVFFFYLFFNLPFLSLKINNNAFLRVDCCVQVSEITVQKLDTQETEKSVMQIVTLGAVSLHFLVGWSCKSYYELSGHAWSFFSLDLCFFFHPGTSRSASLLLLSSMTLWSNFPSLTHHSCPLLQASCSLFFFFPFHPSSVIKLGKLKDRCIKDENKDCELLFYFFLLW